jgi:hypothetical protein
MQKNTAMIDAMLTSEKSLGSSLSLASSATAGAVVAGTARASGATVVTGGVCSSAVAKRVADCAGIERILAVEPITMECC